MEKLQLFNVDDNYISFLKQTDNTVCDNKSKRPYVGPLFSYNGTNFYAPLSTNGFSNVEHKGKPNHDNFIHYKIIGHNKETIGIIRFNNMIPVPDSALKKIDIRTLPQSHKDLLNDDVDFIRSHTNTITARSLSLFKMKSSKVRNNQGTIKYTKMCCKFKELSVKANYFIQDKQSFVADIDINNTSETSLDSINFSPEDRNNLLGKSISVKKVHIDLNNISSNSEDEFLDIGDKALEHGPESQQNKTNFQHTKLNIKSSSFKGFHM